MHLSAVYSGGLRIMNGSLFLDDFGPLGLGLGDQNKTTQPRSVLQNLGINTGAQRGRASRSTILKQLGVAYYGARNDYCPRRNYYWINSEKGGSSNFQDLFTGTNRFQTDSSNLSCAGSKAWKLLETIINSKQGPSRKKSQEFLRN